MIQAFAAYEPSSQLKTFEYDPGVLNDEDVEISIESCGICGSDLSMIDNKWCMTQDPFSLEPIYCNPQP